MQVYATTTSSFKRRKQLLHGDFNVQRRITVGWTAFAKDYDIFNGNFGNSYVFSATIYDLETWPLTHQAENTLAAGQTNYKKEVCYTSYHRTEQHTSGYVKNKRHSD